MAGLVFPKQITMSHRDIEIRETVQSWKNRYWGNTRESRECLHYNYLIEHAMYQTNFKTEKKKQ